MKAGFFKGIINSHAVGQTKASGLPQLIMKVTATHEYDQGGMVELDSDSIFTVTGYSVLMSGMGEPCFAAKDAVRVFGWDGMSFSSLESLDLEGTEITFMLEEEFYNDKLTIKLKYFDKGDATPNGLQRLDPSDIKSLDSKFKNGLMSLGKSSTPKRIEKAPQKTSTKKVTKKKTATKEVAGNKENEPVKGPPKLVGKEELTELEAWTKCEEMATKLGCSSEVLQKKWLEEVEDHINVSGKTDRDFNGSDWSSVHENVIQSLEIPF